MLIISVYVAREPNVLNGIGQAALPKSYASEINMYMEKRLLHGFTEGTPLDSTYSTWSLGFSRSLCSSSLVKAIAPLILNNSGEFCMLQYVVARSLVKR